MTRRWVPSWFDRLRDPSRPDTQRLTATGLALALLFLALAGRLVQVQLVDADRYEQLSVGQREVTVDLPARRGRILDRNGEVLATSLDAASVYADPQHFRPAPDATGTEQPPETSVAEASAALVPVLNMAEDELVDKLSRDTRFVYLARQEPWSVGENVRALDIDGLGVLVEPTRDYPADSLASPLIGITDIDRVGLTGLELVYEDTLAGEVGTLAFERAPGGLAITTAPRHLTPPRPGNDVVLTIDRAIQHVAERAAEDAIDAFAADAAMVTVLDVATGEVLAIASLPSFDPNRRSTMTNDRARLRPITDMFEPGSIQKALTAAAAFDLHVVTPQTQMTVADTVEVAGSTFNDSSKHPTEQMTVRTIMETSSNVGTIQVADLVGKDRLHDYLVRFGYGQRTGIDFPGEAAGMLSDPDKWWATSLPTISIGYGVAVTQMQIANAYATLARGGVSLTPRLVRGTVSADGTFTATAPPEPVRAISERAASEATSVLRAVIEGERGTGRSASIDGYTVAGKTGTARKPNTSGRGYSAEYVSSFVGYAPATDPRIVVAVTVDSPDRDLGYYGSAVAIPAFEEVAQFALTRLQVRPDRTP